MLKIRPDFYKNEPGWRIRTNSQIMDISLCRSVTKNLTPYRFNFFGWGLDGQITEIHSFPTMYIIGGGKWGRNGSKQWFSPKKWSKNTFFGLQLDFFPLQLDFFSAGVGLGRSPPPTKKSPPLIEKVLLLRKKVLLWPKKSYLKKVLLRPKKVLL